MNGTHLIIVLTAKSKLFAKMFWMEGGGREFEKTFLHFAFTRDLFVTPTWLST